MPRAVWVANCAATSRSLASKAGLSGRRTNTAAPITRRLPRSGARIVRCPLGTVLSGPSSSGSAARAAAESPKTGRTPRSTSARAPPDRTSHSSAASGSSGSSVSSSSTKRSRSVRRSRSTNGTAGRSSPTGSGSRRKTSIASENVGTVALHSPSTISSRSMPRAIRRVAAPTNRSLSPSLRAGEAGGVGGGAGMAPAAATSASCCRGRV